MVNFHADKKHTILAKSVNAAKLRSLKVSAQTKPETASTRGIVFHADLTAMQVDNLFADDQTGAGADFAAGRFVAEFDILVEDFCKVLFGQARPGIGSSPALENLTALSIRFWQTCEMRASSSSRG